MQLRIDDWQWTIMDTSLKRSFEPIPFKSDKVTFIKNPLKKLV
jgi:hypothetical protein